MWKSRPDEKPAAPAPQPAPLPVNIPKEVRPVDVLKPADTFRNEVAHIGKSVLIKGELSGSEDLYLDGEVEGNIELRDHSITVGPHGRVRAHINAREIIVHGKVEGNVRATERVELKRTSVLAGDISTQRIVIEDGAFFKGSIDITKEKEKEASKTEAKREPAMAAAASWNAPATPAAAGTAPQPSLLDQKKF